MKTNRIWDWQALSRHFLQQTVEDQQELWAIQDRAQVEPAYQAEYDRILASLSLYHQLWGQACLRSREGLVRALGALRETPVVEGVAYDAGRFDQAWKLLIADLLADYGA